MSDSASSLGYEVRDCRGIAGRPRIEGWVPGMHWPVVTAVEDGRRWLVFVEPAAAKAAGLEGAALVDVHARDVDSAREWVRLIAALYAKAAAK